MTPRRRAALRTPPTHARECVMRWETRIDRSTEFGFAFRAHKLLTVQHLDNVRFADPRALWIVSATLDGREVLVTAPAPLWRFASHVPGSMRITMQPGQLLRFRVRNSSPRNLDACFVLVADTPL